jgi:hypothetical protein
MGLILDIIIVLVILWVLGFAFLPAIGLLINLLLVAVVIIIIIRLLGGATDHWYSHW